MEKDKEEEEEEEEGGRPEAAIDGRRESRIVSHLILIGDRLKCGACRKLS